jgi:subtilisin family serine protease
MKKLLYVFFIMTVVCATTSAYMQPEMIDRDIMFWPDDAFPPFSTVADPENPNVIRVMNADFDPLQNLPVIPQALSLTGEGTPRYQLVQFSGPVTETHKDSLRSAGFEPLVYLSHFTFICRTVSPDAAAAARNMAEIRWVGPFEPAYRIDPLIGQTPMCDPERLEDDHLILIVTLFEGETLSELRSELAHITNEIIDVVDTPYRKSLHIRVHPGAIPDLARIESIYRIEEKGEFFALNDETRYVVQTGSVLAGTPLWEHGVDGTGQIIGVMDSGVDPHHCYFYDEDEGLPGSTVNYNHRKIVAYRTYGGNVWDGCTNGHGTHVAGTAAGYPDDGSSNLEYMGMAPGAKITVGDIGQDDWLSCLFGGVNPPASLTTAFSETLADGGYLHTNSWGGSSNTYDSYCTDVDNFMWNNKTFLILFAAGNSGPNAGTVGYPGTAKNLICAGGSDNLTNMQNMYNNSSRGPVATSNRMAPTVTAPATDTAVSQAGIHSADNTTNPTGRTCGIIFSGWSGTSMATPAIAGAAAMIRQYFVDGYYPGGASGSGPSMIPSAALMKAVLINSAQNMTGTTARPSNDQGWGRIMLDDTLYFEDESRNLFVYDDAAGVATGDTHDYDITVSDPGIPLKISLVWTDRSGNNLVNDLDLVLTNGTTTYYGNNFSGGWSSTGTTRDRTNPAECIYINAGVLPAGAYTIQVEGFNIPNGETGGHQPYALVVSGGIAAGSEPTPTPTQPCINNGDVNFDGVVTAGDSQQAFYIALGMYTPTYEEECAADCNGDSLVTAGDSQKIFFTALGQDSCVDPL